LSSESSNRDVSAEKTEDETVEEGELEGEGDSKETQRKSRSRRKPKGKKHQQEEGKTLRLEPKKQPTMVTKPLCHRNMAHLILSVKSLGQKEINTFI